MTKLLTLLFIFASLTCSAQIRWNIILLSKNYVESPPPNEFTFIQPWPLFHSKTHFYEYIIYGTNGTVAARENGKWIINDGSTALETLLKSIKQSDHEIDELREENARLREAIYNFSPKSFSVNSNSTKSL